MLFMARCCGENVQPAVVARIQSWLTTYGEHLEWLSPAEQATVRVFAPEFGIGDASEELDWPVFLLVFPLRIADGFSRWPFLYPRASRALVPGGIPLGEVARETHKQVMQLISEGY